MAMILSRLSWLSLSLLLCVGCQDGAPDTTSLEGFVDGLETALAVHTDCAKLGPALKNYLDAALEDEAITRALRDSARSGARYDKALEDKLSRVLRRFGEATSRCRAQPQIREATALLSRALGP